MWSALRKGDCDNGGADGIRTRRGAFSSHTGVGRSARKVYSSWHRWRGAVKMDLKERQGDSTAEA